MIRVCIVEDQMLVRQGLCTLLDLVEDIEVIAEAADGQEALKVIQKNRPDVILLDLHMPILNGLDVLKQLAKQTCNPPPVLILTTFTDDELVLQGIQLGAKGYLLKDVSLEQLTNAIRTLASGGTLINPAVTERILRGVSRLTPLKEPWVLAHLTERETQILRMMAGGYTNKEIAKAICLAEGTVKNHISNILSKMGVRDRTRAVLKALELGWI